MCSTISTADQVLTTLKPYNLKDKGNEQYRSNRPWPPESDSMGLCIKIDGPEHGTYTDHVSDEAGSLYQLAEKLGIQIPGKNGRYPESQTKREYSSLEDYAQAHGVEAEVFQLAGWRENTYPYDTPNKGRPALEFPTKNGKRWRFLDNKKPSFVSPKGYKPCWYGLDRAVEGARRSGDPIVICNGEPSTVAAIHHGVPACSSTGGERGKLPENLLTELLAVWAGEIIIVPDCDDAGEKMGRGLLAQLTEAGYSVRVVDLNGGKGFDLADFCKLHGFRCMDELKKLDDLTLETPDSDGPKRAEIRSVKDALQPKEPQQWIIDGLFSEASVNVIVGTYGRFKSYVSLSAGVRVAGGADFLYMKTTQARVLFIDEESGKRRFEFRLEEVIRGEFGDEDTPFYYINLAQFNLRDPDDQALLHDKILVTDAKFVIIDALADIMPGGDENSVKDIQPVFMALRKIANLTGACIVLIHHTNKMGSFRGSTAIGGAIETMLMIDGKKDGHIEFEIEKNRDGEYLKFAADIHFSDGTVYLTSSDSRKGKPGLNKSQEYVIRILTEKGEMRLPDIEANADTCSSRAARSAVYALAREGVIYRTNPGEYGRGVAAKYAITEKDDTEND